MCVDQDGNSSKWWPLIQAAQYGYFHILVQAEISKNCPCISTEVYTDNNKRMDLYCEDLHMVWEVKPDSKSSGIPAAKASLLKYVGNKAEICKHNKRVKYGYTGAFSGCFEASFGSQRYRVVYSTPRRGVVLYDFFPISEEETVREYFTEKVSYRIPTPAVPYSTVGQYGDGGAYASSFLAAAGPAVVGAAAVGCAAALCGGRAQILNECR